MSRLAAILVYVLTAAFFAVFFLYPTTQTLGGAFFDVDGHWTFAYVKEVFKNPIYVEGLRNAFALAVTSTTAAFLLAMPLAWLGDRYEFAGKKLLSAQCCLRRWSCRRSWEPSASRRSSVRTGRSTPCCTTSAYSRQITPSIGSGSTGSGAWSRSTPSTFTRSCILTSRRRWLTSTPRWRKPPKTSAAPGSESSSRSRCRSSLPACLRAARLSSSGRLPNSACR